MEDILSLIFTNQNNDNNIRKLIDNTVVQEIPKWKLTLWENNSIEAALIRVPIVVIVFIILWGGVMLILEKSRYIYILITLSIYINHSLYINLYM
jgi:undecaprenyl pyrophosphate phosphatase UppP